MVAASGQPGHHGMGTVMMQMPQVQYVQPAHIAGGQTGAGVAYQSQPVTYQNAQTPNTQPPPPPAGNPPKDSDQENIFYIFFQNFQPHFLTHYCR